MQPFKMDRLERPWLWPKFWNNKTAEKIYVAGTWTQKKQWKMCESLANQAMNRVGSKFPLTNLGGADSKKITCLIPSAIAY